MHKRKEAGFIHVVAFTLAVLLVIVTVYIVLTKQNKNIGDLLNNNSSNIRFAVYPDTDEAPKLHLYWGAQKSSRIDATTLSEIEKFGVFEDMPLPACDTKKDPGAEWALHFKPGSLPIYTYAPGTITNIQDEGASKELVVRYGRSYAIKYLHVTKVPENIKQGDKIEAGTLIGYTQLLSGNVPYEFWELEVDKIVSKNVARTDFPLNYFDEESKNAFEELKVAAGVTSWFVDENSKEAGWLAYTKKPEAWADISKMGYDSMGDDYCQFLRDSGLL